MSKPSEFKISDRLFTDATQKYANDVISRLAHEKALERAQMIEAFLKPLLDAGASPDSFELVCEDRWEENKLFTVYSLRRK